MLTDRGIQFYTGAGKAIGKFETALRTHSIKHSLARVRHPQTMGKIERYHRSLRQECLNHYQFDDPVQARRLIAEYVANYSSIRKHKGIGRVTPSQRYSGLDKQIRLDRLKLHNQINLSRNLNFDDSSISTEVAFIETLSSITNSFPKEVAML